MASFIYHGQTLSFDLTNADDMARLEAACSGLEAGEALLKRSAAKDGCPPGQAETLRGYYTLFSDFFAALFPGREKLILGKHPSAAEGMKAFCAFLGFLEDCKKEEQQLEEMLLSFYGGGERDAAGTGAV